MRNILIVLIMCIPVLLLAQGAGDVGLLYTLANGSLTSDGTNTYFEFDVMAQADATGTRLGTGIVFLSYSTAFGTSVNNNGNLTVTMGTLLQTPFPPLPFYAIYLRDSLTNVFAVTFEFLQSTGFGTSMPITATQLIHVKMKVVDPEVAAQVCFYHEDMIDETFNDDEATWYDPIDVGSCLYQDPPLPVELSYFSCAMNTANSAVNLTWVSQTETGMVGYRIYRGDTNVLEQAADQEVLIEATNSSQSTIYFFSDTNIESDHVYHYWLEALDLDGSSQFFGPTSITTPGQAYYAPDIPLDTGLTSIYPNPFNPDLTIQYTLDQAKDVQIYVSNIRGQIVRQLVSETKDRGVHQLIWDGRDNNGNACSSGVFYIRMIVGGKDYTRKAILLK